MGIRLIAFDLDGTLLDDQKRLSEPNRRALKACADRGIWLVPCTGRFVRGIPGEVLETGVRYVVAINGALTEDLVSGETLDQRSLKKETALEIMRLADRRPLVMYDAYIGGRGISEEKFYDHLDRFGIPDVLQNMIRQTRIKVDNIIAYTEQSGLPVNKINMYFADAEERRILRERLSMFPDLRITSSVPINLEINSADADKGGALLRLASFLGLSREETMAFGDGENDYTLIQQAGVGVVMANGNDSLKEIADDVTSDNNSSGVARALERLVLKSI